MKLSFYTLFLNKGALFFHFLFIIAEIKLADDNSDYASGQDFALMDLDEACQERMNMKIRYGKNQLLLYQI